MSLTKRLYFDQLEVNSPEARISRISQSIEIAARIISEEYTPNIADLEIAGRRLFAALRELDALAFELQKPNVVSS